jgi:hypothetical protein
MPRYILVEVNSGFVWGDTASLPEFSNTNQTPIDAARVLDESLSEYNRGYEQVFPHEIMGQDGYLVYEVDDTVPVVYDGQDKEMLALLSDYYSPVCAIRSFDPDPYSFGRYYSSDEVDEVSSESG